MSAAMQFPVYYAYLMHMVAFQDALRIVTEASLREFSNIIKRSCAGRVTVLSTSNVRVDYEVG